MRRLIRKSIAVLLIIILLTGFLPNLIISNAVEPSFTIYETGTNSSKITKEVGQEFSIDFDLANGMEGAMCLKTIISYDPNMLEPIPDDIDAENGMMWYEDESLYRDVANALAGLLVENVVDGRNGIAIVHGYTSGSRTVKTDGKLATLKFKLKQIGTTTINIQDIGYTVGDSDEIKYSSTSVVTVSASVPMSGLSLNQKELTMNKGTITTLVATKEPEGTSDSSDIKWSSSDTNIATVVDGKVNAVDVGEVTITAECNGFSDTAKVIIINPMTNLSINQSNLSLNKGQTAKITASKVPIDTTDNTNITYSSNNESVATVNEEGLITAVDNGSAIITATCGSFTATCNVTVESLLVGLKIDKTLVAIDKGQTIELNVTKEPVDTTNTDVITWKSNNEDIATVDENGVVTGVGNGKTIITASCGTFEVTCEVTVKVHIESIEITNGNITLYKNQTEDLTVKFNPTDFSDSKTLFWSSNNEDIVQVSNGTITAISVGKATITAETINGKTASIEVTVPEVKAETLTLNKNITSLEKGEKETLTAKIMPENTTDNINVNWTSDNEDVLTVDENGVITAVAPGTARVIARLGELEAVCTVTVTSTLKSIVLNKNNLELEVGTKSEALVVTLNPIDATVDMSNIKWESLNTSVATVDENGVVTAVAPGTAIIRVTISGKSADCTVKTKVTLTGVEISGEDTVVVQENKTAQLNVVFTPENATEIPEPEWTSDDEEIVKVDKDGIVTGIKEGETVVTVQYGTLIATKKIKVEAIKTTGVTIITDGIQITENEDGEKIAEILKNTETILEYKVMPENSTDKVEWRVSDENVVKIEEVSEISRSNSQKVKLIAVGAGEATIAVTSGSYSDTLHIVVEEKPITSLTVKLENEVIEEEKTTKVSVTYMPEDTTDSKEFTFNSSNESVAIIDSNGVITAKKAGTTYITATAVNGVTSSQTKLLVIEKVENPSESDKNTSEDENVGSVSNNQNSSGGNSTANNIVNTVTTTVSGLVSSPHTGDMNVVGLVILMIASIAGIVILLKKK